MNWFGKKKQKPESNPQLEMLQKISIITRFAKSGLLFIDIKDKKVVISASLASIFLVSNEKWTNFLTNLQLWFVYKASQMLWNQLFLTAEAKAVQQARKKYPLLTKLQEAEIRQKARHEIDIDQVKPPKLEPFDFIISTELTDGNEPAIIAVGRYDNGKFDMTPVEMVQDQMNNE